MKKVLIILILLVSILPVCRARTTNEVDSLRMLVEKLPRNDTARLGYLRRIAIIKQSTPPGLEVARELYQEAGQLGSNRYKAYASFFISLFYANNGVTDSIGAPARESMRLADQEKMWKTYFEAAKLNTNLLVMQEEFEHAIDEASKMYDKANELNYLDGKVTASICLATAYISSDRIQEGVDVLKNVYEDAHKANNTFVLMEIQCLLASTAQHIRNYDDSYIYLNDLNRTLQNYLKSHSFSESYHNIFLFIDIHYAYYYIAKKQPEEALKHLQKARYTQQYSISETYKDIYYDAYIEYYASIGEYDQAIAAADSSIAAFWVFMPKDYYKQLVKKADMLSKAGRYTEALPLYQESLHGKDSVDHVLSGKQMEQIQHIYSKNNLLLENEQLKSNRNTGVLVIIILFTILLTLFIVRALSVRRRLKEAENEMRQATQTAEEANEVKNLFLSNMSYNIRTPLNSVVGFSQLLAVDPDMDEAQRKEYSTIIKRNSEVLLNLVNDVLDISRLEAGMMKFSLQEYEVITLCNEAIYAAKAKNQPIRIDFRATFDEQKIEVDTFRFMQLLVSLLTYPTPVDEAVTVTLTAEIDNTHRCVRFKTVGSPIANPGSTTQEVTIRNDINRLFLQHFGGTYKVDTENPEGPAIIFTYPF